MLPVFKLLSKSRDDLEKVADNAKSRNLKNRGTGVVINCDDTIGGLHTGHVLNRAGDTHRNVEFGTNGFAGLADLM